MARKKWEGAVAALFILAGLGVGGGSKDDQPVITDPVVNTCEHKRCYEHFANAIFVLTKFC